MSGRERDLIRRATRSLHRHVPELAEVAVHELGRGLDNSAFVADHLVLRVADGGSATREARLLELVAQHESIPVPAPRFADEDDGVLAYPLLPGQPLLGRRNPGRQRSRSARGRGGRWRAATVLMKVAAGLLALALAQPWGRRLARPWLLTANGAAGAVLIVWGGANVLVGALVLGEVITPAAAGRRACAALARLRLGPVVPRVGRAPRRGGRAPRAPNEVR